MDVLERLRDLNFGAMVLRLALAMLCGGAVGYGRSKKERPAGLRTYMLVCLGAAAAVLMSLYLYQMLNGMWAKTTAEVGSKFDAARYTAQAVAGIGFIGAGIIIKVSHSQVSGLTTATGLSGDFRAGLYRRGHNRGDQKEIHQGTDHGSRLVDDRYHRTGDRQRIL